MSNLPRKIRMMEIMQDGKEYWNYEVIEQTMKDYGFQGEFSRDTLNMDLIELAAVSFIKEVDLKVDDEGVYKKGFLLHKYVITEDGKARLSEACMNAI
ncbi:MULTISPECIES: hypothetical protein [Methanohalophilus]|jgi:hypothetical protein|uniref:Uncharacterized protein n=1 Tax=Methanohalophilus euhalobius TaxID=51203 RepID=A0A285GHT4_9EURY|nr:MULTISPECIES: hypothetical protein [Methanohalophilus]RSD33135.1 MAG: hypothetical protein CI952_1656 [Methanohalophilus sp.]ODV49902.1 MAG: hypothetical protein A8273_561 [Methanohalophilus sp. 2-GBenrich]PQV43235.1 hypothetical protein B0H22_103249 [Methanohalophilus euhalobius]RNI09211.1 hypothetical protein EDD83_04405 [Methanohalophilus euhalobius]TCL12402.1 hypothetical protein C7960_1653 [Methanohalophilus euhalobius]